MLELESPWALVLLGLPLLLQRWLPEYSERRRAVRAPFFSEIARLSGRQPSDGAVVLRAPIVQRVLVWVSWALLVSALARPVWVDDPIIKTRAARDLLLAVDLSQSMETRDFATDDGERVDRLTAVKQVLDEFIERRKDDRIGLLLFGSAAFVQAPFTEDHDTLRILLDDTAVGMAGPQTVLGEAIGLGIKVFEEQETEDRVLILLTDGNDSGSKVPPERAAEIAAEKDIVLYTIGAGDPEAAGEQALDEDTLTKIAETTGGLYLRATDRTELAAAYDKLDELLPQEIDSVSYRPTYPLFWIPVAAVVLLVLLYHGAILLRSVLR